MKGSVTLQYLVEREMTESVSLAVSGMKCGGCETIVKTKLNEIAGIATVEASSKENTVDVEFDEGKTSIDAISAVIAEAGFIVE